MSFEFYQNITNSLEPIYTTLEKELYEYDGLYIIKISSYSLNNESFIMIGYLEKTDFIKLNQYSISVLSNMSFIPHSEDSPACFTDKKKTNLTNSFFIHGEATSKETFEKQLNKKDLKNKIENL